MDAPRQQPTYATHSNGLILSAEFNPENLESALRYTPNDDDVFLCTYPKCGTTWMQCILHMMRNGGRPLQPGQNVNHFVPHIESDGVQSLQALSRPRIIKTHLPYDMVPKSAKAKYIYIARNPKDCCVSFYHHTKGFVRYYNFGNGTFEDYFELFMEGQVDYNDYFDHLLGWVEHRDRVLLLLYEEMKRDIRGCIRKVGSFLGGPFQQSIERPGVLEQIVCKSSLKEMQSTPSMWSSERGAEFAPFVRKGQVGDWRTHFSEDQSRRMDHKFREKLGGTAAEHLWDDYNCMT